MSNNIEIANIEYGMPTVEVALKKLSFAITTAKHKGSTVVKVIHGYGSSGPGGKIKAAVLQELSRKKRQGLIKAFVEGEKWSIFNPEGRDILNKCSFLTNEADLNRNNPGITIVVL